MNNRPNVETNKAEPNKEDDAVKEKSNTTENKSESSSEDEFSFIEIIFSIKNMETGQEEQTQQAQQAQQQPEQVNENPASNLCFHPECLIRLLQHIEDGINRLQFLKEFSPENSEIDAAIKKIQVVKDTAFSHLVIGSIFSGNVRNARNAATPANTPSENENNNSEPSSEPGMRFGT